MGRNQRSYYAVQKGKQQGVFSTWDECKSNVNGYSGAKFKKFDTLEEAQGFANQSSSSSSSSNNNNNNNYNNNNNNNNNNDYSYSASPSRSYYSPSPSRYSPPSTHYSPSSYGAPSSRKNSRHTSAASTTFSSSAASTPPRQLHSLSATMRSPAPSVKRKRSLDGDRPSIAAAPRKMIKEDVDSNGCIVYTDGASRGNGSKGARAGYGVFWGDGDARNTSGALEGERQTNQRAEATAILKVLEQTQHMNDRLEIRTDSQYCIKAMTEWHQKWQKTDWISSTGGEVQNKDLFEPMLNLVKSRKGETKFVYVPGHQGVYGNEQADALAVAGAESRVKNEKK